MTSSLARRRMQRSLRKDGEELILDKFFQIHGRDCNLAHPRTLTEKLTRRLIKLHRGPCPIHTRLADKYLVREEVRALIGDDHLTNLYWHGTDPTAIPFDTLPSRYVVKSNHASGQVIIVDGIVDRAALIDRVSRWLASNFYWAGRESQYLRIQPRVLVEELLEEPDGSAALNYRFWCFSGIPEIVSVAGQAPSGARFLSRFDANWNAVQFRLERELNRAQPEHRAIPRPPNLEVMLEIATTLSRRHDFVRVDLYDVGGRVVFSELTFTPAAGQFRIVPEAWDHVLGDMWRLRQPSHAEVNADLATLRRAVAARATRARHAAEAVAIAERELKSVTAIDDLVILVDGDVVRSSMRVDRTLLPFTERDGQYWGPPADDRAALAELERLQEAGATTIAFLWNVFWWFDYYGELAQHLRSQFPCLIDNERIVVFDLMGSTE